MGIYEELIARGLIAQVTDEKEIRKVCSEKTFSEESCLKRAIEHFDMNDRFEEYIELYEESYNGRISV